MVAFSTTLQNFSKPTIQMQINQSFFVHAAHNDDEDDVAHCNF